MFSPISFTRRTIATGAALAILAAAGSVSAHHSLTMFDRTKEVEVKGVVTDWQWTNPHSWLEMTAVEQGKTINYSIESNSPNMLTRRGWNRKAIKPGDNITVKIWPYRSGDKGGLLRQVIFEDGKVLDT